MDGWDNARDMQFLEYYRGEGSIWNPQDPTYKDLKVRRQAWERIAKSMDVPVKELKRKKESLMSTYRKIRRGLTVSGGEATRLGGEASKPAWFAFEFIDEFLGEVTHSRAQYALPDETREPPPVKEEVEAQESGDAEDGEEGEPYFYVPCEEPPAKQRRGDVALAYVRQAVTLLGLALRDEGEDECDLYCQLLASRLRKMPEVERYETMHRIDGMLLERRGRGMERGRSSRQKHEVHLEDDSLSS